MPSLLSAPVVVAGLLLTWTARLGCDSGLSSAGFVYATYGGSFARLARTPNVASLLGTKKVNLSAVVIRVVGVATYHLCAKLAPEWGAALPALALTFVLARLSRARSGPAAGALAVNAV